MRRSLVAVCLSLLIAPFAASGDETQQDRLQYPLAQTSLSVRDTALVFKGKWAGPRGSTFNARSVGSIVSIAGAGDSSPITLVPEKWKDLKKGKGYRYTDRSGAAGGIRSIILKFAHNGGTLHLKAAGSNLPIHPASADSVTVTLSIGTARWCAVTGPLKQSGKKMVASSSQAPASCPCASSATGTWQAIQTNIITRYGCAAASCHSGPAPQAGLDLSPDVAYRNLVGVQSVTNPEYERVRRADRTHSTFWLKLAKKTLGGEYESAIGGTGMPSNEFTLTQDELEAVRLWIQNGAPETGVVAGTDTLLAACLPPPDAIKIVRPDPPAAGEGVQFYGPAWTIKPKVEGGANGEDEICQATYYDFTDKIPDDAKLSKDDPLCAALWGGNRDCFYIRRTELTQDPNSHHSIIHIYNGIYDYGTPEYTQGAVGFFNSIGFGPFTCRGGARDTQTCDPGLLSSDCPDGTCAGRTQSSVACFGYGAKDFQASVNGNGTATAPTVGGSQQPYSVQHLPPGVFAIYPVKGTMVWNSHAFNVTAKPTTNEQYLNVFFATDPADKIDILRPIFQSNHIFTENVPPFQKVEYCNTQTLPQGARVSGVSSHTHKRGLLFRIWTPPNAPCEPCAGGAGSCQTPNPACASDSRTPIAVTTTYNDPVQYEFATPLALDAADVASRTLKFCSVYDNGATVPAAVKRQSTSPPGILGGPCPNTTVACLNEGPNKGKLCGGDDRVCDTPGQSDGVCDACPLMGGVTTEDEMFILLGDWYCPGTLAKTPLTCPGH